MTTRRCAPSPATRWCRRSTATSATRYLAHLRTLLDTVYDWQVLGPRVAKLQALIGADLAVDNKRLYSMQLFADDEPGDGPLHATLKLAAGGEELALFDPDGVTLLDHVVFGPQRADGSAGRLFDGRGAWVTFPLDQTPDALNAGAACGRRSYSALEPATHAMVLRGAGTTRIGASEQWQITSAPPSDQVILVLAGSGGALPIPGHTVSLLIGDPLLMVVPLATDAQGTASLTLPIPDDPNIVGARVYGATFAAGATGLLASNAVELVVCPR